MKLTSLQLQNIACFEDLTLDLTDERGNPASWVVLVGENGTGKSTVLQMLAAGLLGPWLLPTVTSEIAWNQYVRLASFNADDTKRRFLFVFEQDGNDEGKLENYAPSFQIAGNHIIWDFLTVSHEVSPLSDIAYPGSPKNTIFSNLITGGWFASGYSPWRRGNRQNNGNPIPTLSDSEKPYRFATLFGDDSRLTPISWIAQLYVRTIHPDRTDSDQQRFDRIIAALERVLPGVKFNRVTADQEVLVEEAGVIVPLERLSDGYRSTFTWIIDLVRRLFDAFPDSPDPLQESGVVLVDELDLHLHPKWQRRVVTDIRRLFPNLQFIVTTHSPFIAQDLTERDKIFVLERTGRDGAGPVVARPAEGDSGVFADWSADQLYGRFFGLENGTEDESVLKQKARYEHLLDKEAANALSLRQRDELDRLRLRFSHAPLSPDATSEDYYRAADALLASLDVRRKQTRRRTNGNGKNGTKAGDDAS